MLPLLLFLPRLLRAAAAAAVAAIHGLEHVWLLASLQARQEDADSFGYRLMTVAAAAVVVVARYGHTSTRDRSCQSATWASLA